MTTLTEGTKQPTKKTRYSHLRAFFNFIKNNRYPDLPNPCDTPILRKLFKRAKMNQWVILEKETIDEIIFRTTKPRNRIMLELMARGGMRIGEVLNLTPNDIDDQKLTVRKPKSGKESEVVFIPRKLATRLKDYIKEKDIQPNQRVFPITYNAVRIVVNKAGELIGVKLRCHDLRRHAATYASRSGLPIEIVSKVILRHANLSTTQHYLGKITDTEAIRWIENLYG